ncbi:MAG: Zinc transporter ZupT [Thermoleophilia bacterium]|nr:Zinc transporter ZupT [Thermoleophilia bacterium]
MVALLLSLIAAAGFAGANLLAGSAVGASTTLHRLSMVVAAAVLFGVAVSDLLPEAFELAPGSRGALAIVGGFLVLYLVETLTGGHTFHHEPHVVGADGAGGGGAHAHAHAHSHGPAGDLGCVPTHAVLPFLLGLGFHNLADGLVIGASQASSDTAATGIAVGILVHQVPVGLSFAAVLLASGMSMRRVWRHALAVAALIPLGTTAVLLAPDPAGATLGVMVGAAAGSLLYIATGHLLPEAHSESRHPRTAVLFSAVLVGTVGFVGLVGG